MVAREKPPPGSYKPSRSLERPRHPRVKPPETRDPHPPTHFQQDAQQRPVRRLADGPRRDLHRPGLRPPAPARGIRDERAPVLQRLAAEDADDPSGHEP